VIEPSLSSSKLVEAPAPLVYVPDTVLPAGGTRVPAKAATPAVATVFTVLKLPAASSYL
jgi:hypothetical protein